MRRGAEAGFCDDVNFDFLILVGIRWHHLYGRKWRRTKEPLDESERGEWKSWLKAQHSENEVSSLHGK